MNENSQWNARALAELDQCLQKEYSKLDAIVKDETIGYAMLSMAREKFLEDDIHRNVIVSKLFTIGFAEFARKVLERITALETQKEEP